MKLRAGLLAVFALLAAVPAWAESPVPRSRRPTAVSNVEQVGDYFQTSAGPVWVALQQFNRTTGAIWQAAPAGARGDGVQLTDGVMALGSCTLSSASAAFTAADVTTPPKLIDVQGAGTGGGVLATTVAAVVDAHHVTTSACAATAVTSSSPAAVQYGTDNYSALQVAFNAAANSTQGWVNLTWDLTGTYLTSQPVIAHDQVPVVADWQSALSSGQGYHFNRVPQQKFTSDVDVHLVAAAPMARMLLLSDNGSYLPSPNSMKIENIVFDGNNLLTMNFKAIIENSYAAKLTVSNIKCIRATICYYNDGIGITDFYHNTAWTKYGVWNSKGGDSNWARNDLYPTAGGAGFYFSAGTGNDHFDHNTCTVSPGDWTGSFCIEINAADTTGVPLIGTMLVPAPGYANVRDDSIKDTECNGTQYCIGLFGMTAAQKTAWLALQPGEVWDLTGKTLVNTVVEDVHAFNTATASQPVTLIYFTDVGKLKVLNSDLKAVGTAPMPMGGHGIYGARSYSLIIDGNTWWNLADQPAYCSACQAIEYTKNHHFADGSSSTNTADVQFDSGSTGVATGNFFDTNGTGSNVAFSNTGGSTVSGSGNINLAGMASMSLYASAPALTSCGTSPSLAAGSADVGGTITEGTTAPGCTATFGKPFLTAPICTVSSPTGSALTSYSASTTALTIVNASASGNQYSYLCSGQQ